MAAYRSLIAWRGAHDLAPEIHRARREFPEDERFELTPRLRRAALSAPANLAEGRGALGTIGFLRYVRIAASSPAAVDYLLLRSRDMGYLIGDPDDRLRQLPARAAFRVWRLAKGLQHAPRRSPG